MCSKYILFNEQHGTCLASCSLSSLNVALQLSHHHRFSCQLRRDTLDVSCLIGMTDWKVSTGSVLSVYTTQYTRTMQGMFGASVSEMALG